MEQERIGILSGKKGLITGITNHMSIAWTIAQSLSAQGAQLAFTYPSEAIEKRIIPLANELNVKFIYECDVIRPDSVVNSFNSFKNDLGDLDFVIHAIAYADKNELRGKYIDTSLENFTNALNISCYSLTMLAKHAYPLMRDNGGSILTLTYYGSQKVIPCYNVMGVAKAALETSVKYLAYDLGPENIRVNAISAGPIRTLASSGINNFKTMLSIHQQSSPLRRNTTLKDVAGAALYLISDLASGVTGEIHYVDGGYSTLGMNLLG